MQHALFFVGLFGEMVIKNEWREDIILRFKINFNSLIDIE